MLNGHMRKMSAIYKPDPFTKSGRILIGYVEKIGTKYRGRDFTGKIAYLPLLPTFDEACKQVEYFDRYGPPAVA